MATNLQTRIQEGMQIDDGVSKNGGHWHIASHY